MKKLLLSLLMVSCGLCSFAQSDYTIEFKVSSSNDGSGITAKSTKVSAAVTTASAEYVDGTFTQAERAYYNSKKGLKFGTGSGTGSTTFALSSKGQILASGLIVNAASYSTSDTNTSVKITINDSDEYETIQFTNADLADYTITFSSPTVINSIKLESKGTVAKKSRVYIGALTVIASTSSPDLLPAGLSFPEATYSATLGQEFTAPVLTNPNNLDVTYSSSDPAVATVDPATGLITLHRGGKTTITATSEATDTYAAGSAFYTLNVVEVIANHLGQITLNGTPVSTDANYQFFENTPLTIACENAEELIIEIRDETDTPVTDNTFVDSYTWTPAAPGTYSAIVFASGCDELCEATFTITILEKPAAEWTKVTDLNQFRAGYEYVFVGAGYVMSTDQVPTKAADVILGVEYDSDEDGNLIDVPSNAAIMTAVATGEENQYYFMCGSKYLWCSSAKKSTFHESSKEAFTLSMNSNGTVAFACATAKDSKKDCKFYVNPNQGTNPRFAPYSSNQTSITVYYRTSAVLPEQPSILINGAPVDLDNNYDLNQSSVTITLTAPEGHHIYYKHVAAGTTENVRAKVVTDDGYTVVENNVATVEINTNGTLYFHSLHPETGLKSDTKTLTFVGATTSIEELTSPAETSPAEIFDLQGRRVTTAPRRGLYIIKQGSNVSKRAL